MQAEILVLDDDAALRLVFATALEDAGFLVREAANGAEALALLRKPISVPSACRILLVDVHLGGEPDGLTVASEAMRHDADLWVLYCTGFPDALSHRDLGRRERALIKPFQASYLVEVALGVM